MLCHHSAKQLVPVRLDAPIYTFFACYRFDGMFAFPNLWLAGVPDDIRHRQVGTPETFTQLSGSLVSVEIA